MSELVKYRWYLLAIALLILAKFVWVPQWQQKQQVWDQVQGFQMNSHKYQALLAQKETLASRAEMAGQSLQALQQVFPEVSSLTQFKLGQQAVIEQLFKEAGLRMTMSSWRSGAPEHGVEDLYLDVNFDGELAQYLGLMQQLPLLESFFGALVSERVQLSQRNAAISEARTRGQISFRFRYLNTEAADE